MKRSSTIPILSYVLYGLAILTFLAAIWLLFTALSFNLQGGSPLQDLLIAFGPVAGLLAKMVNNAVAIVGLVFAGLAFTISALLFTAAQMIIHFMRLSERVEALESKLEGKLETGDSDLPTSS